MAKPAQAGGRPPQLTSKSCSAAALRPRARRASGPGACRRDRCAPQLRRICGGRPLCSARLQRQRHVGAGAREARQLAELADEEPRAGLLDVAPARPCRRARGLREHRRSRSPRGQSRGRPDRRRPPRSERRRGRAVRRARARRDSGRRLLDEPPRAAGCPRTSARCASARSCGRRPPPPTAPGGRRSGPHEGNEEAAASRGVSMASPSLAIARSSPRARRQPGTPVRRWRSHAPAPRCRAPRPAPAQTACPRTPWSRDPQRRRGSASSRPVCSAWAGSTSVSRSSTPAKMTSRPVRMSLMSESRETTLKDSAVGLVPEDEAGLLPLAEVLTHRRNHHDEGREGVRLARLPAPPPTAASSPRTCRTSSAAARRNARIGQDLAEVLRAVAVEIGRGALRQLLGEGSPRGALVRLKRLPGCSSVVPSGRSRLDGRRSRGPRPRSSRRRG